MTAELIKILWPVLLGCVTVLLGLNGWFISRLVSNLDSIGAKVDGLSILSVKVEAMSQELTRLARGQEDISTLRERVAVLESQLKQGKAPGHDRH